MSNDKIAIPDEVCQIIEKIIVENDLEESAKIEYGEGSEIGDGYTSKTLTVDVNDGKKSLYLFLKIPLDLSWLENLPMKKLFDNEIYFYGTIYPAYQEFLKERGVEDGFRNAPKCYAIKDNMLALENLKKKKFCMFTKGKQIDDAHFLLVAKTFAKLHAVSFAFKDQKKELHEIFKKNIHSCTKEVMAGAGFSKLLNIFVKEFFKNLDPVEDKYILDACCDLVENLPDNLADILLNIDSYSNEYSTITQGDSWTNNMLYLYEEENQDYPIDMMLIDWQLVRNGSPAADLCYLFYTISSGSTLENLEYYMKEYHKELSTEIRKLGSDPDILYPYAVFKEEWKKFAPYGLAIAFFALRSLLTEKEEMLNMEEYPEILEMIENGFEEVSTSMPKMKNDDLYQSRMKTIIKHFIKNDFLS